MCGHSSALTQHRTLGHTERALPGTPLITVTRPARTTAEATVPFLRTSFIVPSTSLPSTAIASLVTSAARDEHDAWCSGRGLVAAPGADVRRAASERGRSSARELSQIVPHNSLRSRSICSCCGRREFFACPKGCRSFFSVDGDAASRVYLCNISH